jgi:hypothetical protein
LSVDSNPRSLNQFRASVPLRTAHPRGARRLAPDLGKNAALRRFLNPRSPYGLPTIFQAPNRGPVVCGFEPTISQPDLSVFLLSSLFCTKAWSAQMPAFCIASP